MAIDVKTMKKLFAAMAEFNVAGLEFSEPGGATIKVAMHDSAEAIETDARSVGFVQTATDEDSDDEDEEIEAKRAANKVGFQPPVESKPGLYDSRTLHLKDFD